MNHGFSEHSYETLIDDRDRMFGEEGIDVATLETKEPRAPEETDGSSIDEPVHAGHGHAKLGRDFAHREERRSFSLVERYCTHSHEMMIRA